MRRTRAEGPTAPRERHPVAYSPRPADAPRAVMAGGTFPAPKSEPYRNPVLLAMAKDRPCLLLVPGVCNHRIDTTVACHSNLSRHGKAGARKADDFYSVWGCVACHTWLDQGAAPAELKEAAFMDALRRQFQAWMAVRTDKSEPARFQRAATSALLRLTAASTKEST